uniref:F-box domain-containing protein n=1 Tax=Triticum urartu TaxID=4572 RepID=A0A8R7V0J6_TRIUA
MEAPPREIDAHPFPSSSASAATASSSSSLTESAIVQVMANRTCSASVSSLFASSRPQGWAELPDDLLRPVVALLRSFRDLLAFGTTCRHWCDFFSAHRSSVQPLLLHPNLRTDGGQTLSHNCWTLFHKCTWRLADPAATSSYRSFLSLSDLRGMTFLRCSYGQLIFFDNKWVPYC